MSLNVNRNVQDPFYRYKMPPIAAKVEGKGNGIKTVLANVVDVARALARPPTYVTKYFGCELGAQTQFDLKNERYIVNGAHEGGRLQEMLDGFIKKFVLCEQCENPETVMKVCGAKKGAHIKASCKACGHVFMLDMKHKLTTFIIKNPPEVKSVAKPAATAAADAAVAAATVTSKGSKSKRTAKDSPSEVVGNGHGASNGNGAANGVGGDDHVIGGVTNDHEDDNGIDDDDWAEDVSDAAVKARMAQLSAGVKGLAVDADCDKSEAERINLFHDFVRRQLDAGTINDKAVVSEGERLEVAVKAPLVLCELLLLPTKEGGGVSAAHVIATLKTNQRLFLRFVGNGNHKAQKYLLGGLEKTIESDTTGSLLAKTPALLKAVYDCDLVDEDILIDWAKKASKKFVTRELAEQIREKAAPFITWLREAEEETSDEEDSDGADFELEYDERAKIASIQEAKVDDADGVDKNGRASVVNKTSDTKSADDDDDDDDDINIDDI